MKKLILAVGAAAVLLSACNHSGNSGAEGDSAQLALSDSVPTENARIEAAADTFSYQGYRMVADMLAGKKPQDASFMSEVTSTSAFNNHCQEMTAKWAEYKKYPVDVVRAWSKANITTPVDTLFYPFGGPDFNYMNSFFPDVRYSLLIGIEKPGSIPFADAKSRANASKVLETLRFSTRYNMRANFFVTSQMEKDLNSELQGTLPVVMMFMAMHGYEVLTVNPIRLNDKGELEYTEPDKVFAHTMDKKFDQGYEIMYRLPGEHGVRKLNYLRTDLSNEGFAKVPMLRTLIDNTFNGKTTMLKAASYLMHYDGFSKIRNAILDNSAMVITGPSGIPWRDFSPSKWDVTLYGRWTAPIKDFVNCPQNDLKAAYEKAPKNPIEFRYDYGGGGGFFVARKK